MSADWLQWADLSLAEQRAVREARRLVLREIGRESPLRFRHACVFVYRERIVASGVNRRLSWESEAGRRYTTHAEMDALRKRPGRISSAVVLSLTRAGRLRSSKPCRRCTAALEDAGVSRIIYSAHDGLIRGCPFSAGTIFLTAGYSEKARTTC